MQSIEKYLNYEFENPHLLENALTHTSFANEKRQYSRQ